MRTQAIIDYALKAAAAGSSEQEIKNALTQAGWSQADIDDSIAEAQKPQPTVTPAPMMPNLMPKQPSVATPADIPATQSIPLQATPQVNTPYQPVGQVITQSQPSRRRPSIIPIVIAILFLGSIGGAFAYTYTQQLWPFTPKELSPTELINVFVDATSQLKTATYKANFIFELQKRDPDITTIDDPTNSIADIQALPEDMHATAEISGTADFQHKEQADGTLHIKGDARLEGMNVSIDLETIKKNTDMYLKLNELQIPFLSKSIGALKNKWIHVSSDDTANAFSELAGLDSASSKKAPDPKIQEKVKLFLNTALQEGLIHIGKRSIEKYDARQAFHYPISIDLTKAASFEKAVASAFEAQYGKDNGITFDQSYYDEYSNPKIQSVLAYISRNTSIDMWIDAKTFTPLKTTVSLRIAPSGKTFEGKQIHLGMSLTLANIDTPLAAVEAPKDALSYDEAVMLISGMTKEEYTLQKQYSAVTSIQSALRSYQRTTNTYPDTLNDLLKTRESVTQGKTSDDTSEYLANIPFLTKIPVDAYTKQLFVYKKLSNNYSLSYTIHLPTYAEGSVPSYYVYERKYSAYDPKNPGKNFTPSSHLRFIEGTNTAVSGLISVEANLKASLDTDNDGLSDTLENYIGTNPKKKDSDGDGKGDNEELTASSNPAGPGFLKRQQMETYLPF